MKWIIIFWFLLALSVPVIFGLPFRKNIEIYDVLGLLLLMLTMVAIYGNAYQIVIGNKFFAITVFAVNMVTIGYISYILLASLFSTDSLGEKMGIIISFIIAIIYMLPITRYAFMSKTLWEQTHNKSLQSDAKKRRA